MISLILTNNCEVQPLYASSHNLDVFFSFPDCLCDIYQKTSRTSDFYKSINDYLTEVSPRKEIFYLNQTLIPNDLKVSTASRKMMLYRIDNVGEYPLTDILKQPITTSLDIHVSTGTGEILSLRGEEPGTQYHITTVDPNTSFYILKCQTALTRFVLLVNSAPMSLAIEINSPLDDTAETAGRLPDLCPLATHQSSFLKRLDLPLKEIRSRLLFLDASFSETVHGTLSPISLTVLDYHGNSLINTVLCPRAQIKEYGRQVHGFSERDLLGKADGHEVLARLHSLVVDRVLVGFELRQKLAGLRVDLRAVCGLRELQGCAALARVMGCAGPWSLAAVAKAVLDHQFQEAVYSAEYIAHVVWRLYVALEAHWQDSGPPPATVAKAASSISVLAGYDRGGRRHIKEAAGINY